MNQLPPHLAILVCRRLGLSNILKLNLYCSLIASPLGDYHIFIHKPNIVILWLPGIFSQRKYQTGPLAIIFTVDMNTWRRGNNENPELS
jgi:hypothetical protein